MRSPSQLVIIVAPILLMFGTGCQGIADGIAGLLGVGGGSEIVEQAGFISLADSGSTTVGSQAESVASSAGVGAPVSHIHNPEPGSVMLFSTGLLGVACLLQRNHRKRRKES